MLIDIDGHIIDEEIIKNQKIVFYGASTRNSKAISKLDIKTNMLYYIDRDISKKNTILNDYFIYAPDKIKEDTSVIIITVLINNFKEISEMFNNMGIVNKLYFFIEESKFDYEYAFKNNMSIVCKETDFEYLHHFNNDKFIVPFYNMLEEKDDINRHLFVVDFTIKDDFAGIMSFIKEKNSSYHNIILINLDTPFNTRSFKNINCNEVFYGEEYSDILVHIKRIIFHSAFWSKWLTNYIIENMMKYSDKMVWLAHGGDMYFEKDSVIVNSILKKVKYAYAGEYVHILKKNYDMDGINVEFPYTYISEKVKNDLRENNLKIEKKYKLRIMAGHSAADYVDHISGLNCLSKFKDEDIIIYSPLTYGEKNVESIISYGIGMFGSKFVPLVEHMDMDSYYKFISTIDIFIFPFRGRIGGVTTMRYLNLLKKKMYVSNDAYSILVREGIKVDLINKIEEKSIMDLINESKSIDLTEISNIIDKFNNDAYITWKTIMD